jgi:RHS repeat-associated protein
VALLPGGRIVVGGNSNNDFALAVYGERLYAQQDANYNVASVTNAAGAVVERYRYDPYGAVTVLNGAVDNDGAVSDWSADADNASDWGWVYLHQGGRYDASSGNYSFRARENDISLGRWNRADPIGYTASMNLYEYVSSSPVSRMDPSGMLPYDNLPRPEWDSPVGRGMSESGGWTNVGRSRYKIIPTGNGTCVYVRQRLSGYSMIPYGNSSYASPNWSTVAVIQVPCQQPGPRSGCCIQYQPYWQASGYTSFSSCVSGEYGRYTTGVPGVLIGGASTGAAIGSAVVIGAEAAATTLLGIPSAAITLYEAGSYLTNRALCSQQVCVRYG